MKKILFSILLITLFACLFAISVSATDWFGNVEIIDNNNDGVSDINISDMVSSIVAKDEANGVIGTDEARAKIKCTCAQGTHTFPAYYLCLKSTGTRFYCFDYSKLNALLGDYCGGSAINGTSVLAYELPNGYQAVYSGLLYDLNTMNGKSIEYFNFATCSTLTSLEATSSARNWFTDTPIKEVNLGPYITNIPVMLLYNCKNLEEITIPDQITTIGSQAFMYSTNLKRVYISKTSQLQTIGVAAFSRCSSLEAFYIPSGITSLAPDGSNNSQFNHCTNIYFINDPSETTKPDVYYIPENITSIAGELFKGCTNLNNTIVFHEGITNLPNGWAFNGSNAVNVVFLGNMEKVSTSGNAWNSNIHIYYCNENDLSSDDVQMSTNAKKHYCHAEGNTAHLEGVYETSEATCEKAKGVYVYCFCGELLSSTTEGDALGHDTTSDKAIFEGISYVNYFEAGTYNYTCGRCEKSCTSAQKAEAIFEWKGYSCATYSNDGTYSMSQGFYVNTKAVEEYEAYAQGFAYGLVAAVGSVDSEKAVYIPWNKLSFNYLDIKIVGISEENKDTAIIFCAYVIDGEDTYYLDNNTTSNSVSGVSYSYVAGLK